MSITRATWWATLLLAWWPIACGTTRTIRASEADTQEVREALSPAELDSLIEQLGSESILKRQDATVKLLDADEGAVARLMAGLGSCDYLKRGGCANILAGLASKGIKVPLEPLSKLLEEGTAAERAGAADVLGQMLVKDAWKSLLDATQDPDVRVIRAAAEALGRLRDRRSISRLSEMLNDDDPITRAVAVKALGDIGGEGSVKVIRQAFKDEHAYVRLKAIDAIGDRNIDDVLYQLIITLQDPDRIVRHAASRTIIQVANDAEESLQHLPDDERWRIRQKRARQIGIKEVTRNKLLALLSGSDMQAALGASAALSLVAEKSVIPSLRKLRGSEKGQTRLAATDALGRLQTSATHTDLVAALKDSNILVRLSAVVYLGRSGDPRGLQALRGVVAHIGKDVRTYEMQAIWALGEAQDGRSVPVLIKLLSHHSSLIREASVIALGRIGDKTVKAELERLDSDPDKKVRAAVSESLKQLGADVKEPRSENP